MSEASDHGRQRGHDSPRKKQPRDVSGTEWRSTGHKEERTEWSGDEQAGAFKCNIKSFEIIR